jgi:hypothetical protein
VEVEVQAKIKDLIWQYKHTADKDCLLDRYDKKALHVVRNKIYKLIYNDLLKWIKGILSGYGKFEDETEIISISWDAFCFCLEYYNNFEFKIQDHFIKHLKYFFLNKYAREGTIRIEFEELKETLRVVSAKDDRIFVALMTLEQFRDVLPEKHQLIWDDAFNSMQRDNRVNAPRNYKKVGVTKQTYDELKKSFKEIIRLILK